MHGKDTEVHVNKTIEWVEAQPEFDWDCSLYQNTYFGYDPRNPHYQEVSRYFLDHYSLELDSWRDQPLWCYVMHRFQLKPILMGDEEILFDRAMDRLGHGRHRHVRNDKKKHKSKLRTKK